MSGIGSALVAALLSAGVALLAVRTLLTRLPEPTDAPPDKVPYAELGGWSTAIACAVLSATAVGLAWLAVPVPARPLWVVLGTAALLLAAVDARTTWLPLRLTRVAWVLMGAAVLLGGALAGIDGGTPAAVAFLLRAGTGVLVGGALYLLIWVITRGGFGFGDVRFAPLVGAAAAAPSLSLLFWALVLGSVLGGLYGIVRLVRRRPGHFPYSPAMLGGAYLALAAATAPGLVRSLTG